MKATSKDLEVIFDEDSGADEAAVIRWRGADYPVIEPVVVDWATVRSAFYPVERVLMPLIGIEQFVRVRHASATSRLSQT